MELYLSRVQKGVTQWGALQRSGVAPSPVEPAPCGLLGQHGAPIKLGVCWSCMRKSLANVDDAKGHKPRFERGSVVTLSPTFANSSNLDARAGPLKVGQIGFVVQIDKSNEALQMVLVRSVSGSAWWYCPGALSLLHEPELFGKGGSSDRVTVRDDYAISAHALFRVVQPLSQSVSRYFELIPPDLWKSHVRSSVSRHLIKNLRLPIAFRSKCHSSSCQPMAKFQRSFCFCTRPKNPVLSCRSMIRPQWKTLRGVSPPSTNLCGNTIAKPPTNTQPSLWHTFSLKWPIPALTPPWKR